MNMGILAIVAVVLVVVIALAGKKDDLPKEPPIPNRESSGFIPESLNGAVVIYEYHKDENRIRCRVCDAENDVDADCCMVCGERLY